MRIGSFEFTRTESGGLDIAVSGIVQVNLTEEQLYEMLASLGLAAEEEEDVAEELEELDGIEDEVLKED
jgi:hypothetical protein